MFDPFGYWTLWASIDALSKKIDIVLAAVTAATPEQLEQLRLKLKAETDLLDKAVHDNQ